MLQKNSGRLLWLALLGGLLGVIALSAVLQWPEPDPDPRERHALRLVATHIKVQMEDGVLRPIARRAPAGDDGRFTDASLAYLPLVEALDRSAWKSEGISLEQLHHSGRFRKLRDEALAAGCFQAFADLQALLTPIEWLQGARLLGRAVAQPAIGIEPRERALWYSFCLQYAADLHQVGLLDFVRHASDLVNACRAPLRECLAEPGIEAEFLASLAYRLSNWRRSLPPAEVVARNESLIAQGFVLAMTDIEPFHRLRVEWGLRTSSLPLGQAKACMESLEGYEDQLLNLLQRGTGPRHRDHYKRWRAALPAAAEEARALVADPMAAQAWIQSPAGLFLIEVETLIAEERAETGNLPTSLRTVILAARRLDPDLADGFPTKQYRPTSTGPGFELQASESAVTAYLRGGSRRVASDDGGK